MNAARAASAALLLVSVSCGNASGTATGGTPALSSAIAAGASERHVSVGEARAELCEGDESFPMEVAGSLEYVSVVLPGASSNEALRFKIDTAGSYEGLHIEPDAARRLGFTRTEQLPRAIMISGKGIALPVGVNWVTLDEGEIEPGFNLARGKDWSQGEIGAGFLSRFVVCIDPARGRIGFGEPQKFDVRADDENFIPLLMSKGHAKWPVFPFVHAVVRRGEQSLDSYGMLIDTGSPTSRLETDKLFVLRAAAPEWAFATGPFGDFDTGGGRDDQEILRAGDVSIDAPTSLLSELGLSEQPKADLGPATLVGSRIRNWDEEFGSVGAAGGSHGSIGNDVLLRQKMLIDYPHARLFLAPSGLEAAPSASSSTIGISVLFGKDGCPSVQGLTDTNALQTLANLKLHDVIQSIDGEDVCKLYHHQLAARLAGPPGTFKKLQVRRKEQLFDIDVKTAELLTTKMKSP